MKQVTFADSPPFAGHDKFACLAVNNFSVGTWKTLMTRWPTGPQPCPTSPPPVNPTANFNGEQNALSYIDAADRDGWWEIAQKYELGDRFFAVSSSNSFPAHQYIVSAAVVERRKTAHRRPADGLRV